MRARSVGAFLLALGAVAGLLLLVRGRTRPTDRTATERTLETAEREAPPPALEPAPDAALAAGAPESPSAHAERTPVTSDLVELLVLDGSGTPLAGARWVVFRVLQVLDAGETGADGRAQTRLAPEVGEVGEVEVAIHRDDFLTQRFAADLAQKPCVVQLSADGEIAGRVTVDGALPAEPINLGLSQNGPPLLESFFLPVPIWEALGESGRGVERLKATVDAGGAFRFIGLEPGKELRLSWPDDLSEAPLSAEQAVADPGAFSDAVMGTKRVVPPDRSVALALFSRAYVFGRVVDAGGAPLPSAHVQCGWTDGRTSIERGAQTQKDGTFRAFFGPAMPDSFVLRVAGPRDVGARALELKPPPGTRAYDAGDVAILPVRRLALEVRSRAGVPVPRAAVQVLNEERKPHNVLRTSEDGLVELWISPETSVVRIEALGYRILELPPPPGEHAAVELESDTTLEVHLAGEPGLQLELQCAEPPFLDAGKPSRTPPIPPASQSGWTSGGPDRSVFSSAPDGTYVLSGLRAGLPLVLRAVDPHQTVLAEKAVAPLGDGERRLVELRVEAGALPVVNGIVLDASGAPLSGAEVRIVRPGWETTPGIPTQEDGAFRLRTMGERLTVAIQHPEHAPLVAHDLAAGDEPHTLRLVRGLSLTVEVLDPQGEPAEHCVVTAQVAGAPRPISAQATAPGTFVLSHLPAEELALAANVGAHRIERRHDPVAQPVARIEVPAPIELVVLVVGAPKTSPSRSISLQVEPLEPEPKPEAWLFRHLSGLPEEELIFPAVVPGPYRFLVKEFTQGPATIVGEPQTFDIAAAEDGGPARVTLRVEQR